MSFALTTEQVVNRTKTVTRRMGWTFLKPGDLVQPVKKCMGLKPGEKLQKIGGPIRITDVRREPLWDITLDDCVREGFYDLTPPQFCNMFADHNGCAVSDLVTRIEFTYEGA